MSRLPRIVVTGVAHHVTQRGNRRQRVFLIDDDYALYKDWLEQSSKANGVAVWSYVAKRILRPYIRAWDEAWCHLWP